jgi:putative DNA primase/helicase
MGGKGINGAERKHMCFASGNESARGRWNESRIKTLTGGDTISARFMRQDFFEYTPQFKLVIAGNHKPAIRNVDEAMRRRLHLIPFTITIAPDKRDSQLTEKLLAERSGILAWAVEGCQHWLKDGLKAPAVVCEATKEYFNNEDAIQEFEDELLVRDVQFQTPIAKVYGAWKAFAERNGYYVGSVRWLTEQMITRDLQRSRGTGGVKCLRGIRLKQEEKETYKAYLDD